MGATLICLPNVVTYLSKVCEEMIHFYLLFCLTARMQDFLCYSIVLHGYSGKVAAFRGQRIIYSMQLVQLTESLAYLAKRQVFTNTEATIFEKLSAKK